MTNEVIMPNDKEVNRALVAKKAIFINGSPRKNKNTAQDLQKAYDLGKRLVEKAKEQ